MVKKGRVKILLTLLIGFSGAAAATYVGFPAAALIGSSLAVSFASLLNLTCTIPTGFRAVAFTIIGCTLGSSITKSFIDQAIHWPLSLLILTIAVITILLVCSWILTKFFNQSPETAILATSPGALAYSLSIAAEGIGDLRSIVVIQSVRVLLIIAILPFFLDTFSDESGMVTGEMATSHMDIIEFSVIFLLSIGAGWVLEKVRLPAAYLLTGTLVSGIAHFLGFVSGRPAGEMLFVGFAITGTIIGARFSAISKQDLRSLLKASLVVVIVSTSLAAVFAKIVSIMLSLTFGQVFVAYAPGGVEAMAAMALSLGYDPAFVASHHLYRILLLIVLLPLFLTLTRNRCQT